MSTASQSRSTRIVHTDGLDNSDGLSGRSDALSNKLTSVLSSSYADAEIRDALRLFGTRYSQHHFSDDFDLKHEAQKEATQANGRIIEDFSIVAQQLNRVGVLIANLNQTCDDIRKHVLAAKQETAPMLEEASALLAQKKEAEQKQQLLDAFNAHFLLKDSELTMLTSSAEPIDDTFFDVLTRTKQIHKDCELLLGYENQRLGLELMEQTTRNLDAAYKKLFNHTLRQFKGLDLEDPRSSASFRRSLRALSERPALFQKCLDSFAEARQSTIQDSFQKALTDSTMGAARAIDFSTHDPLRYIGDMLAWVHSATVSEMEALESLFIGGADEIERSFRAGRTTDPVAVVMNDAQADETPFDGHAALNSLISRNMASVAHTLTQRITVTARNLSDPVEIYKAYNVLSFYHDMFLKFVRPSAPPMADMEATPDSADNTLLSALTRLQEQTFSHFQSSALESLHADIEPSPSTDLTPPPALSDALSAFTTITQTRGPALTLPEFTKLYTTLLGPILQSCKDLAEEASELPGATKATSLIYKLNYMTLVRSTLAALMSSKNKIEAAQQPLQHADTEIDLLRSSLTDLLSESFIESSGLNDLHDLLDDAPSPQSVSAAKRKQVLLKRSSDDDEASEDNLEMLAHRLDAFLASALMDAQDGLANLTDKSTSATVLKTAVEVFVGKFDDAAGQLDEIDEGVEREALAKSMGKSTGVNGTVEEGDDELPLMREVYPRTLDEVRALLS